MLAAILLLVPLLLLAAAASEPCGRSDALSSLAARGLPSPSWVAPDDEKAADPAAAYITGQVLQVDGGMVMS